jgi:hypothetical protein
MEPEETKPVTETETEKDAKISLSLDGSKEAYACGHMRGYRQGVNDVLFWMVAGVLVFGLSYEIFGSIR